ncbi:putative lipoprotein [Brucella ovis ATCC 25840]|uniref:Lipoprotein n=1 Tax=Brucella ovis (strain ATCC 25840 / 63/290 / NCTC 10512) TaxID=444178 RepID=A0A0H3AN52_BRUO2|nr:putative lipoprotein [Brucella ovis ATCC 25840]
MRYSKSAATYIRKAMAMNKKMLILLGLASLLAGCVTMTPEQRRAADEQTCRSYGFKPKTDAFANCLMRIDLDRRADRRAWQNQVDFYDPPMVIYQPIYRPVPVVAKK